MVFQLDYSLHNNFYESIMYGTMGLPPDSFYNDFAMILLSNWDSLFIGLKKSNKV